MGDTSGEWSIEYARELHTVDDSKLIPPVARWAERGFTRNCFDSWIGKNGEVALPVYEGRHIGQFECAKKGWVSGKGRTAIWRTVAETAGSLSNDEFFEILGIPELTSAEAAKAKGLPGPLILKRDGCHVWKPENFPLDDPRHGWTWDDCWNDAVALLGSEDAVREYIEGKPDQPKEEPEHTGPRDLFGDPIIQKPKQRKMF